MLARALTVVALGFAGLVAAGDPRQLVNQAQAYATIPTAVVEGKERYDGDQVIRLNWHGTARSIKDEVMQAVEYMNLDVWRSTPTNIDIRLPGHYVSILESYLPKSMTYTTLITNLQDLIDETAVSSGMMYDQSRGRSNLSIPFHDVYHTLDEVYAFGASLVAEYSDVLESFVVGTSAEGREIVGYRAHIWGQNKGTLRKGKKGSDGGSDEGFTGKNLEFIVQSGQHAREWIGPSTAMYFLHHILTSARENPSGEMVKFLKSFTFTIIPTINPDGYVYSHEHARMWRKSRQDVGHRQCLGIDLNSNWGYKWRYPKSSACSDTYAGREAFDAPETRAMEWYLTNGTKPELSSGERTIRAFVDLHSYGQLFMFPFAVTCDDFPRDAEMLMEAGLGVSKAMRQRKGEEYEAGQACDLTYRAPGDAIDFAYGITDVRWSYSAELRDTGTYGFMLPAEQIRASAEEVADGLTYLARFIYEAEIAN